MQDILEDSIAASLLSNPLALAWLLTDAPAPIPHSDLLTNAFLVHDTLTPTPATTASFLNQISSPINYCPKLLSRVSYPNLAAEKSLKTLVAFHQVLGGLAFGTLYEASAASSASEEQHNASENAPGMPVSRKIVARLEDYATIKVARYPDGHVLVSTVAVAVPEKNAATSSSACAAADAEPEIKSFSYLFDGFPALDFAAPSPGSSSSHGGGGIAVASSAEGGRFPNLLFKVVIEQTRQCPFCNVNKVVCECPAAYRNEFLPTVSDAAGDAATGTLNGYVEFMARLMAAPTHMEMAMQTAWCEDAMRMSFFSASEVSMSSPSVREFAKREYQRYFKFHGTPMVRGLAGVVGKGLGAEEGKRQIICSGGWRKELPPCPPDLLFDTLHMIIEDPVQFLTGMRLSNPRMVVAADERAAKLLEMRVNELSFGTGDELDGVPSITVSSLFGPPDKPMSEMAPRGECSTEAGACGEIKYGNGRAEMDRFMELSYDVDISLSVLEGEQPQLPEVDLSDFDCPKLAEHGDSSFRAVESHNGESTKKSSAHSSEPSVPFSIDFTEPVMERMGSDSFDLDDANCDFEDSEIADSVDVKMISVNGDRHTCETCGKYFKRPTDLKRHYNSNHNEEKRPFACTLCTAHFKQKWHLSSHMQGVHSGKKPFVCSNCEFPFARKSDLTKHVKTVHG